MGLKPHKNIHVILTWLPGQHEMAEYFPKSLADQRAFFQRWERDNAAGRGQIKTLSVAEYNQMRRAQQADRERRAAHPEDYR